jgi:starvation-inducible DNA-binding protein
MHKTAIDLPLKTRTSIIKILNTRLTDAIDLSVQAKLAHWNVRGANFLTLHKLFDDVAQMASEHTDLLAERIGQLGGAVDGSIQTVVKKTSLPTFSPTLSKEKPVMNAVIKSLAHYAKHMRHAIETTDDLDDEVTSDICTEITRAADKMLWFVEAHGQ